MQVVLDTNVWIDWLLFKDASAAPLKAAQRNGSIRISIDEACLDELDAVLAYPEFRLDEAQRNTHLAEVHRCTVRHLGASKARPASLPLCTDPDDQKFLALAHAAPADWLLTRDKALLRLDRRLQKLGMRVGSPAQWCAVFRG